MDWSTTYTVATATRLLAADMFDSLDESQWRTTSLCSGWTVREVAAHLAEPLESRVGTLGLLVALVRHRGSLDRMVDAGARAYAERPTAELVGLLRERADVRLDPPVIGPRGPMADALIHLRDAARPLGLPVDPPPEHWRHVLDFLLDPRATTRGFLAVRLDGLHPVAVDQDWSAGSGAELRGPSEALVMALTGRQVALAALTGDGADVLRDRLRAGR